jgi:hypothetical protein
MLLTLKPRLSISPVIPACAGMTGLMDNLDFKDSIPFVLFAEDALDLHGWCNTLD